MNVKDMNAVVVGLGRSGLSALTLLRDRGARVTGTDAASTPELEGRVAPFREAGVAVVTGGYDEAALAEADLVVVSPGVPDFPALAHAERSGREVIGELELASRFVEAPIVLIGGTNGKSTTTALTAEMFRAQGKRTFVGGNFGIPLAEAVGVSYDVCVVEISSFQAERLPTLRARAHALLNITDDHLDRYVDFTAYARAKGNPFERMTTDDVAVVPWGDELVLAQAKRGRAQIVTFDTQGRADVTLLDEAIVDRRSGLRFPLASLRISGLHNIANACASVGVATALGVDARAIERAFGDFVGLEHRTALVADHLGVRWYDDSKGTNVGATVAALSGLREAKAVLIAGGRDKLGSYEPLIQSLRDRGRGLVVIGEAAERIASAAEGVVPILRAESMREAVRAAGTLARPGDAVLLSPACSSFDMFRDYKDRGDRFVVAVKELVGEAT
jgi:UDP-N-acetylmuramoylalanine--D-glutamate ligase